MDDAPPPTDEDLYTPATVLRFPTQDEPQDAAETATHATGRVEVLGATGGPSPRGKRGATSPAKAATDSPYRRRVSDAFGEAFTEVFGVRYPWVFVGKDHDGSKVKVWIAAAKIKEDEPEPGLQRLRGAALAYCRAVEAGRVFPYDEKANTRRFTAGIAEWLQTDPNERPKARARTAAEERQRTLAGLDRAIEEAQRREKATC